MSKANKKQNSSKIYVNIGKDTIEKLDTLALEYGTTRSSLIALFVQKQLQQEWVVREALNNALTPTGMASMIEQLGFKDTLLKMAQNEAQYEK